VVALLPDRLVVSGSREDAPAVPLHSFDRTQVRPLVLSSDCNSWRKDLDHQQGCVNDLLFDDGKRVRAMVLFGGLGTSLGAVIGVLRGLDRWQEVRSDRLRVGLAPQQRGVVLGASVGF